MERSCEIDKGLVRSHVSDPRGGQGGQQCAGRMLVTTSEGGDTAFLKPLKEVWGRQSLLLREAMNLPVTCLEGLHDGTQAAPEISGGCTGWASPGDHTDASAVPAKGAPVGEVVTHGSVGHGNCEKAEMKILGGGWEESRRAQTGGTK